MTREPTSTTAFLPDAASFLRSSYPTLIAPNRFYLVRAWDLPRGLSPTEVGSIVTALRARHPALTSVLRQGIDGWAATHEPRPVSAVQRVEMAAIPADRRADLVQHLADALGATLAVDGGALTSFVQVVAGPGDRDFLLGVLHHLVCDEYSLRVLGRDLQGLLDGHPLNGQDGYLDLLERLGEPVEHVPSAPVKPIVLQAQTTVHVAASGADPRGRVERVLCAALSRLAEVIASPPIYQRVHHGRDVIDAAAYPQDAVELMGAVGWFTQTRSYRGHDGEPAPRRVPADLWFNTFGSPISRSMSGEESWANGLGFPKDPCFEGTPLALELTTGPSEDLLRFVWSERIWRRPDVERIARLVRADITDNP